MMSYLYCIGIIFAVHSVTMAAETCCFPQKYEGLVSQQMVSSGDAQGGIHFVEAEFNISVDYVGKMEAISFLYYDVDGHSLPPLFILVDYQNGIEYIVQENTCQKVVIPKSMPSNCLPDGATQVLKDHFGAANEILPIKRYVYKPPNLNLTEIVSVTETYCYPVMLTQIVGGTDTRVLFSGLSLGINNPDIFNVPDVCKHTVPNDKIILKDFRMRLFTWVK